MSGPARVCGWCGRRAEDYGIQKLKNCSKCKKVAYCDLECQKKAWKSHRPLCRASSLDDTPKNIRRSLSEDETQIKEETAIKLYGNDYQKYIKLGRAPGRFGARVGLRNEGNTCYLNGVVQALSYSPLGKFLLSSAKISSKKTKHGFNLMHELARHVRQVEKMNEILAARDAYTHAQKYLNEMVQAESSEEDSDDEIFEQKQQKAQEVLVRPANGKRDKIQMVRTTADLSISDTILKCTQHAGHMEDAHECLTYLLERLLDACAIDFFGKRDENWEKSTIIYNIFGLDLVQLVNCKECNHVINTEITELMLRLNATLGLDAQALAAACQGNASAQIKRRRTLFLRKRKAALSSQRYSYKNVDDDLSEDDLSEIDHAGPPPTSISELLKYFFAAEQLEGYACDNCKQRDTSSKGLRFQLLPESLALYIDRIPAFGSDFGKLNRKVALDPLLDLDHLLANEQSSNYIYRLYAIVCHLDFWGSTFFGHYITYILDNQCEWWLLDDESVKKIEWSDLKATVNPDLLFYDKISRDSPLVDLIRHNDETAMRHIQTSFSSVSPAGEDDSVKMSTRHPIHIVESNDTEDSDNGPTTSAEDSYSILQNLDIEAETGLV